MMKNEADRSKVIAVTSGKGGVGKTNIASNLSICFAANNKKVLLFDADLGLGNVDVVINTESNYNLTHVLSGYKTLEEIILGLNFTHLLAIEKQQIKLCEHFKIRT